LIEKTKEIKLLYADFEAYDAELFKTTEQVDE
jgi:hypothetical protein